MGSNLIREMSSQGSGTMRPNWALPVRTAVSLRSTPDPPSVSVLGYARAATSAMRIRRPMQKIISRALQLFAVVRRRTHSSACFYYNLFWGIISDVFLINF